MVCRDVLGFPLVVGTVESVASELERIAQTTTRAFTVAAADVHVITHGIESAEYSRVLRKIDLICPDGMPLVFLLNRKREQSPVARRVSGPDLMTEMMARPLRHFFLGGSEKTLALLAKNFQNKFPTSQIVGAYSPPFSQWDQGEQGEIVGQIRQSHANIVWVGLGCPKQERLMASWKELLPAAVYLGVGAAFDFHAGTIQRAPLWMQKSSLEWLYRIVMEPRRLLKRYLKYNSLFMWYLLIGKKARHES